MWAGPGRMGLPSACPSLFEGRHRLDGPGLARQPLGETRWVGVDGPPKLSTPVPQERGRGGRRRPGLRGDADLVEAPGGPQALGHRACAFFLAATGLGHPMPEPMRHHPREVPRGRRGHGQRAPGLAVPRQWPGVPDRGPPTALSASGSPATRVRWRWVGVSRGTGKHRHGPQSQVGVHLWAAGPQPRAVEMGRLSLTAHYRRPLEARRGRRSAASVS